MLLPTKQNPPPDQRINRCQKRPWHSGPGIHGFESGNSVLTSTFSVTAAWTENFSSQNHRNNQTIISALLPPIAPLSPMDSALPPFPRSSRQKQIPNSSRVNHCHEECPPPLQGTDLHTTTTTDSFSIHHKPRRRL